MKYPLGIRVDTPLRLWLFVLSVTLFAMIASVVTIALILWLSGYQSSPIAYLIGGAVPLIVMPPVTYILAQIAYELTCAQEELIRQAYTDDLTGLYNRRAFFEHGNTMVSKATERGVIVGLLLLDVDNFKQINDSFGHLAGDEALRHLAQMILRCTVPTDVVSRFGGDEFGILRCNATHAEMSALSASIQTELLYDQPIYRTSPLELSVSAGVADSTVAATFDTLLLSADIAFYSSKGHNHIATQQTHASV